MFHEVSCRAIDAQVGFSCLFFLDFSKGNFSFHIFSFKNLTVDHNTFYNSQFRKWLHFYHVLWMPGASPLVWKYLIKMLFIEVGDTSVPGADVKACKEIHSEVTSAHAHISSEQLEAWSYFMKSTSVNFNVKSIKLIRGEQNDSKFQPRSFFFREKSPTTDKRCLTYSMFYLQTPE